MDNQNKNQQAQGHPTQGQQGQQARSQQAQGQPAQDRQGQQTGQSQNHKALAPVGGYVFGKDPVVFNESRPAMELKVRNTGDRPIQVGSHFHFFEVNRALEFDREAAYGMRLNIASSTAIRFEPGDEKSVSLVPFGGLRNVHGFNNLVDGWAGDMHIRPIKVEQALALGFKSAKH